MLYLNYLFFLYAAARALEVLNFTPLNSKSIRICYSLRDPTIRKSGTGNIFIKVYIFFGLLSGFHLLSQEDCFVYMYTRVQLYTLLFHLSAESGQGN